MSGPASDREGTAVGERLGEGRYGLAARPEEVTHLVCCRDVSWRKTFCGEDGTHVNLAAEIVCTMCL